MTSKWTAARSTTLGLALATLPALPLACSSASDAGTASGASATAALAARPEGTQRLFGHVPSLAESTPVVRRLEPTALMSLSIGLPLRDADALKDLATKVSDPSSASYRHYLTPDEVAASFGPTEADHQAVLDFARSQGLTVVHTFSNRLVVHVTGAAADVERAFHLTMNVHRRVDGTEFFAPDREPSVDLAIPILHVTGLDDTFTPYPLGKATPILARPVAVAGKTLGASGPGGNYYDARDLHAAYASCTTATGAGQTLGLFEMDGYTPGDIAGYDTYGAGIAQAPLKNILLGGATGVPGGASDEVTADIELANAMAPGLSQIAVFEGPDTFAGVDIILAAMTTTLPLANQISSSWWYQLDATSAQLFAVLAAQGQSFFQSSGDDGSYPANLQGVVNASDITIVGGTNLTMNGAGVSYASESGLNADGMLSGGGIECCEPNLPIPGYQTWVSMAHNGGSTTNRNSPDVSMVGSDVFIYWNGESAAFVGTSASAPLWAGFMALANQESQVNGIAPVGFANPALYGMSTSPSAYAADFNDVADGSSNGSYAAVAGYDLVTGLGTPKCGLVQALATPSLTRCQMTTLTAKNTHPGTFAPGITSNFVVPPSINAAESSLGYLQFSRTGKVVTTCHYAETGAVEDCTPDAQVIADSVELVYGPQPLGYSNATLRYSFGGGASMCVQ